MSFARTSSRTSRRPSHGIISFLDKSITNPDENNIFNFTLPTNAKSTIKKDSIAHLKFKSFVTRIIRDIAEKELDENIGEIITIHPYPSPPTSISPSSSSSKEEADINILQKRFPVLVGKV
jgi:hypothetical protein